MNTKELTRAEAEAEFDALYEVTAVDLIAEQNEALFDSLIAALGGF